jgi:hypothetical protein
VDQPRGRGGRPGHDQEAERVGLAGVRQDRDEQRDQRTAGPEPRLRAGHHGDVHARPGNRDLHGMLLSPDETRHALWIGRACAKP